MDTSDLCPLRVASVIQGPDQQPPMLLLEDDHGRRLDIPIGVCEALAIQLGLNRTVVGRPLSHDLFLGLAERLQAIVLRVVIDDCSHGTYYARIVMEGLEGEITLDTRPSDGVAIALRCEAPLFASEAVMMGSEE